MNAEERTLLTRFLDELAAARTSAKDGEAEAMIARTLSSNPDAAYLLVQHAIVADQSLHAAQQRIAELERQQPQYAPAPSGSGFLPQGAGGPWGARPQDSYAPPPPEARPGVFSGGGGLGSFLRSAGTTAAGVVGGQMLFSGLSDMFGHQGGGGLFGGGGGQGFMERPENITINNYGDDDDRRFDDGGMDNSGDFDPSDDY
ncbi:hypothetical protein QE385_001686 [Sphingomonas sp. SORGH_AS 950]|uniref:DUF2076 domain-containing protein n=1 Tax=Sphingomonas sp. SORGH_AS_0950 TaxID=3041792 RepID=UPI0027814C8A|nr:DUF2076 domain-containing protein [Sphingomonas sp. SORGH_AS_0950]MDQ1157359.1 hypothetical protein [Sphingomonas sp. SORGH_AS_0950]